MVVTTAQVGDVVNSVHHMVEMVQLHDYIFLSSHTMRSRKNATPQPFRRVGGSRRSSNGGCSSWSVAKVALGEELLASALGM